MNADPEELAEALSARRGDNADATVTRLPAGPSVRLATATTLDHYVRMPGGVGYLLLSFTVPLNGVKSPMGELCEAIATSLRWVTSSGSM
ncbi:hypothetical protein SUDANB176_04279 [Streptomyces sp. enrichment culture]|uniref:hypothetical protein n=1 Tax=Streptomyces sp. enrichment culture TaxID=1795815 RepID=UPI003F55180D